MYSILRTARVGKNKISIPKNTAVSISVSEVNVKGPLGEMKMHIDEALSIHQEEGILRVSSKRDIKNTPRTAAIWGTVQRLLHNMIKGVSEGFERTVELVGVGYRASLQGSQLVLQLGYSHDITYVVPAGIRIICEKPTLIKVLGADRQKVGEVIAFLKSLRKREPYKGKGVIPDNCIKIMKEGKKK